MTATDEPPGGARRGRALLAGAGLAALYWLVATAGPLAVGAWQDDAIYLATAKALASGAGYRHVEIPGEPFQTKYPVLYPALLAPLWWAAPAYPDNVPLLLLPGALAAAALVLLSAACWRRSLGASRRCVLLLLPLAALSPPLVSMVRFTMSDLPYAVLALGAVAVLDRAAPGRAGPRPRAVVLAALLAAAAILTRSIGVSVAAGALLFLARRGGRRPALLFAATVAVCLAPWLLWQAGAAAANAPFAETLLLRSELGYGVWLPRFPDSLLVFAQNLAKVAFGLLYFELAVPPSFALGALAEGSWRTAVLHAAGWGTGVLVIAGFAASARRRPRALHVCAALYALLALSYPGDPYRFLLPWSPFLLYFLFAGLGAATRRWPRLRRGAQAALYAALLVLFAVEAGRIARSTAAEFHFRVAGKNFAELRELERFVRVFTDEGDAIASADFAALYLATGRQGYYLWPILDPYALFYGGGRSAWSFFIPPGRGTRGALERETRARLLDAYREAGVRWYVDGTRADFVTDAVRAAVAAHPAHFPPRHTTPGAEYRVHHVRYR